MEQLDPGLRALAGMLTRIQKDLRSQGRASQAAFRSVEAGNGPVRYYAPGKNGEVLGEIVAGPGGIELRPTPSTPPATPTAPDAVGVQGGIVVKYDGTFIGANWSATISHVEVHRGTTLGFTPSDETIVGTYTSYWGGEVWVAAHPSEGPQFFRLITVDRAGGRSTPSGADSATALATHVGSDGEAPEVSPAPVVRGGVGALFVTWTPVGNEDPVDYYIHISTVDDFAPSPSTLVAETAGSSIVLKTLPNGDALAYDTVYYVKIVAEDADGAAPASTQGGASMMKVTGEDIAVNYVYAGNILADQIEGGSIRSAVTIAGLFQTATSGGRVEMGPFGLRVYDANGIDINVDLSGVVNRFRGSIDAVDIIIRDALQMFGKNNIMGVGSELALASATSAPAQPPVLSWEYEAGPAVPNDYYSLVGAHLNDAGANLSYTASFLNVGLAVNAAGGRYTWPLITGPDNVNRSTFVPVSSMRIVRASDNAERLVTIGPRWDRLTNGYPETWVRIYDDSTMVANGSVAPILKTEFKFDNFSWVRRYRLGRLVNGGGWKNWFMVMEEQIPLTDGDPRDLRVILYSNDADGAATNQNESFFNDVLLGNETLAGGVYGTYAGLGLEPGGVGTALVIQTNLRNRVYDSAAASFTAASEWPTAYQTQDYAFTGGNLVTNVVDRYYTMNAANTGSQKIFKYAKNHKSGDRTIWGSYAWRAEATKAYLTEDSALTSIAYRRMARLKVSVPALPAPIAGVGSARDPNADAYGWVYYLGTGAVAPANDQMFLQAVQPTMVPGAVLAASSITLDTYPAAAGNNPVLAATFPASSPARIRSTGNDTNGSPLLLLTGAGLVKGSVFENPSALADAFTGRAFDQMDYIARSQLVLNGGGKRTVSPATGKMYWPSPFAVVGAGRHPNYSPDGTFTIAYPTTGTSIPVHNSTVRTSVVAAADGIPLVGDETIWYELPLGGLTASVPGRFHIVGWNSNDAFIPPPGWIFIGARFSAFPNFKWGTGDTDTGWNYLTLTGNWQAYNAAIVPSTGARVRVQNDHTTFQYAVKSGTAGASICTIPDNYRPSAELHPIGRASDGNVFDGPAWSTISATTGAVTPGQGYTFYRMLTVTYPAST